MIIISALFFFFIVSFLNTIFTTAVIAVPDIKITVQAKGWNEVAFTDHNGYFFGIGGVAFGGVKSGFQDIFNPLSRGKFLNNIPIGAYQSKIGAPNNIQKIREIQ